MAKLGLQAILCGMSENEPHYRVGMLGAGKLAQCFVQGWIASGKLEERNFVLSVRSEASATKLQERWPDALVTHDNKELVSRCNIVVLGVEPHYVEEVLKSLEEVEWKNKLLVCLAAGFSADRLRNVAPHYPNRVGRLMANVAVAFRRGLMAFDEDVDLNPIERALFEKLGHVLSISDENFDAYTVATASAPAFCLQWQHEVVSAIAGLGFEKNEAEMFGVALLRGMLQQLEQNPDAASWRDQIATPGGMTAEGLAVLQNSGLSNAVKEAFAKTLNKAKSLS